MANPQIPADFLQFTDQSWQYARDELAIIVGKLREEMDMRQQRTGILDDSVSFAITWDEITHFMQARQPDQPVDEYTSMILTTALMQCARTPLTEDPLEQLEKEITK